MTARGPGVKDDPAVIMRRMMITLLLSKARHNRSAYLQAHFFLILKIEGKKKKEKSL
jgi:hypothetical protein